MRRSATLIGNLGHAQQGATEADAYHEITDLLGCNRFFPEDAQREPGQHLMHQQDDIDGLHLFVIVFTAHFLLDIVRAVDAGHTSDREFKLYDLLFYFLLSYF